MIEESFLSSINDLVMRNRDSVVDSHSLFGTERMETSLNLAPPTHAQSQSATLRDHAVTTRVQPVDRPDPAAILPDNNPFIAQIVTARLSGSDYPDNPAEIAPRDRTLRPYDVPMLPFDDDSETGSFDDAAAPADNFNATADHPVRAAD